MTVKYLLSLDLMSYWHPGTGRGSSSHVDAVVDKDLFGCPFISGRMLKGLLRDVVYLCATWGIYSPPDAPAPEELIESLFGSSAFQNKRPRDETLPGLIRVHDAVLDDRVRKWLAHSDNRIYRNALFHDIYSTAINESRRSNGTGTAKARSLRGQQVVVPMVLNAMIEIIEPKAYLGQRAEVSRWVFEHAKNMIERSLPLLRAVGANRTRGFGRVRISMKEVPE